MKILRSSLACLFLLVFILCACHNKYANDGPYRNTEDINKIILEFLQNEENSELFNLSVDYSKILDIGEYYHYIVESSDDKYEGVALIVNGKVSCYDLAKCEMDEDITVHMFSGAVKNEDNTKSLFLTCSGMVNNDKIEKIHAYFSDGSLYEMRIGAFSSYNIVILGQQPSLIKIETFDNNDKLLFIYPDNYGVVN